MNPMSKEHSLEEKLERLGAENEDLLKRISELEEAGRKMIKFYSGYERIKGVRYIHHHIWCNAPRDAGFGNGRCNCGVSDMLTALGDPEPSP